MAAAPDPPFSATHALDDARAPVDTEVGGRRRRSSKAAVSLKAFGVVDALGGAWTWAALRADARVS